MLNMLLFYLAPAADKENMTEEAHKGNMLEQLRRSSMQLLTGGPDVDSDPPLTPAQSLANVGWAIFVLITLTAYTANLAAFLVVPSEPLLTIASMRAAVEMQASSSKSVVISKCVKASPWVYRGDLTITVHLASVSVYILLHRVLELCSVGNRDH